MAHVIGKTRLLYRFDSLLLSAAILAACSPPKIPTGTDELDTLRTAWTLAFNGKQLEAITPMYAIDAVFLPITGNRVVSRLAIHNLYEQIWSRFTPQLKLTTKITERSANLAYESGDYSETITSGTERLDVSGSYVFVYRHDQDGWHIQTQIFTEKGGDHPVE
jgi:ketosteroid isomerase-like protein